MEYIGSKFMFVYIQNKQNSNSDYRSEIKTFRQNKIILISSILKTKLFNFPYEKKYYQRLPETRFLKRSFSTFRVSQSVRTRQLGPFR